jgi:proteasome lid subunit RPN8/RPN11
MNDRVSQKFSIPGAAWQLSIEGAALELLSKRAQRRWYQRETVGQLFTRDLTQPVIGISEATVLRPTWASWSGVKFDVAEAMEQRERMLERNFFCVGIWHTHPEASCEPSPTDSRLAADHARAARPVLNGLVFAIVSNKDVPTGWYVGVHDGAVFHRAAAVVGKRHAVARSCAAADTLTSKRDSRPSGND